MQLCLSGWAGIQTGAGVRRALTRVLDVVDIQTLDMGSKPSLTLPERILTVFDLGLGIHNSLFYPGNSVSKAFHVDHPM